MPASHNPDARDHFVYVVHARGYPFYVGHGRGGRLSDRARFIDSLVRNHSDRSYGKWTLHGSTVAELWAARVDVCFDQISEAQTKYEAAAQEGDLLRKFMAQGFLMSNKAGNPRARSATDIASAILASDGSCDALPSTAPINRYRRPGQLIACDPRVQDTARQLISLAESPASHLHENESQTRQFPAGAPKVQPKGRQLPRERVDPSARMVLIDTSGRHRFLVQRLHEGEWKYVVGTGRSGGATIFVSALEDVIRQVIIGGRTVTARTARPGRLQRSGVTVPGKAIRAYWLSPDLAHVVHRASTPPLGNLPPER